MPALSISSPFLSPVGQDAALPLLSRDAVAAINTWRVICAWPVSGQYGFGSRCLYYVLVAACVLARKTEWLRNACLAAALLFPAVAALHGIVLAAVHTDGAVDMDVYGAFQFCSIGILAAPVTVRLSRTYFYDPGRNIIFLWTGLIFAGLLSLTVEFYRSEPSNCSRDDDGNPIPFSRDAAQFPYQTTTCGLVCSAELGPHSRIREGAADNIYVIPAPDKLTFGTATLLAAACCIPAILSLASMWNKILEINWKTRFGGKREDDRVDELIEGTNGATIGKMKGINAMIRSFLTVVEAPAFGGAVLAILIVGERNLFSTQVRYQTEPVTSIGQWAPIVGTGLAALGSLYIMLAGDREAEPDRGCDCSGCHVAGTQGDTLHPLTGRSGSPNSEDVLDRAENVARRSPPEGRFDIPQMEVIVNGPTPAHTDPEIIPGADRAYTGPLGDVASKDGPPDLQIRRTWTADIVNRRKVAQTLTAIGNYLGTPAQSTFDDSEFKHGKALDFPEIPGEERRNRVLPQIREQYNQPRDTDGNVTPTLLERRSRASSFNSTIVIGMGDSSTPRAVSPHPPSPRSQSPSPSSRTTPRQHHASTFPLRRSSSELRQSTSSSPCNFPGELSQQRRDTLDVPTPTYLGHSRSPSATSTVASFSTIMTTVAGETQPAIVVSPDPDMI